MEQQQSSATMAMDPDRKIQKEFAENCQNDTIVIVCFPFGFLISNYYYYCVVIRRRCK